MGVMWFAYIGVLTITYFPIKVYRTNHHFHGTTIFGECTFSMILLCVADNNIPSRNTSHVAVHLLLMLPCMRHSTSIVLAQSDVGPSIFYDLPRFCDLLCFEINRPHFLGINCITYTSNKISFYCVSLNKPQKCYHRSQVNVHRYR